MDVRTGFPIVEGWKQHNAPVRWFKPTNATQTYAQTGTAPATPPIPRGSARDVRRRVAPLLAAVRSAVSARNWHAALALALALPDICAGVEVPVPHASTPTLSRRQKRQLRAERGLPPGTPIQSTTGELADDTSEPMQRSESRYRAWVRQHLPTRMTSNGADLAPTPFLDDDDLYQLRCAYLHSGHEVLDRARARHTLARVRFAYPSVHGFYGHYNYIASGAFVQVQVDEFCEELCAAAESWLRTTIDARASGPWNTANMLEVLSVEEAISTPHRPLWDVQLMPPPRLPRPSQRVP